MSLSQLLLASGRREVPGDQATVPLRGTQGTAKLPSFGHTLGVRRPLVSEVGRRGEEAALSLAPCVHQRGALLLPVQGGAVLTGQGQVGGDALPQAVAEEGLVHAQGVFCSLGALLQSVSGKTGAEGRKRERDAREWRTRRGRRRKKGLVSISPLLVRILLIFAAV